MAKSILLASGSLFCGNPIAAKVTASSTPSSATFHKVKLAVTVTLSSVGLSRTYILSTPANSSETVIIDVSSALRAVAGEYVPTPQTEATRVYPYLAFTLKAYDEYMIDGLLYENVGTVSYGSSLYALPGAFTDVERYLAGDTKAVTAFTRKPDYGEIAVAGTDYLYPVLPVEALNLNSILTKGPTVEKQTLAEGMQTIAGRKVYGIADDGLRKNFQFLNKLGVVETVSAESLEELTSTSTTEIDTVTAPGSFYPGRRIQPRRGSSQQIMKMSSGFVTREWADWWVNEFLRTDACWINLSGSWIPCLPKPSDETSIYNRSDSGLISIEFDLHLSLNGGWMNKI